ncbi:MAG: DUF3147 family protein [Terriglobia bacterium]
MVKLNFRALRETTWQEYTLRFAIGGAVTALAGVIITFFGPAIGGLFLAFPAVFPSSASLIAKHEKEREGTPLSREAAKAKSKVGYDATGAALGSVGLFVFALIIWRLLPCHRAWPVLVGSTAVWAGVALAAWALFQKIKRSLPAGQKNDA